MELKNYIREIENFPKEGIGYKDISPLLLDHKAMKEVVVNFIGKLPDAKIDKVVGMESRGFFFASLLAQELKAGFVPVRKPGKLPAKTFKQEYDLEYGSDSLEIHQDAIQEGENVLIHDDVLATGGTALATCKLVEKCKGNIVQCNFLIELDFLNGRDRISNYEVESLIHY
ncbi:adenine phosphoribosyltransferase [Christiangramia sp. OXR-203]|jgi:adenine phosphoribosyltransferase|uniref:adenine phosphoribosyltransferase n=2 Tax=unclassified Christiangramia TaxID=2615027 RepID=UPI002AC8F483|nr:adenine phosphoribosyltransferase [Christiangramia sp. OXR-203]WPY97986.1 adenine phosphoribosyltransferase [Christiangramia sp. OXR-203]